MMSLEKTAKVTLVVVALGYGAIVFRTVEATDDGGPPMGALCLAAPAFLLLLAAGATWKRQAGDQTSHSRLRRAPGTFCTHCGRNLTGNVGGTCPECGTTVGVPPLP